MCSYSLKNTILFNILFSSFWITTKIAKIFTLLKLKTRFSLFLKKNVSSRPIKNLWDFATHHWLRAFTEIIRPSPFSVRNIFSTNVSGIVRIESMDLLLPNSSKQFVTVRKKDNFEPLSSATPAFSSFHPPPLSLFFSFPSSVEWIK